MLYKNDWERAQKKYIEYWAKENHDRPLINVVAPKDGYVPKLVQTPESLIDRWTDVEYVIKSRRESFAATFYGGEAYPDLWPNLGPDILGAILGCEIEFGENTSWAIHNIHDWENVGKFEFNPQNKWWKKIKEMTEAIAADSKGDYFVGITDLHAGADGIVSLRGPEELCYDLLDYPDIIKRVNFEIFEAFKKVFDELYNITSKNMKGTSNWMGVWHPEKWYVSSSDFICMISPDMFSEFIMPELLAELEWLDASIFHLDGPGALKHLDTLLEIPNLNGIQWVQGAGQPPVSQWIPVLKKIQDAGKLIQVNIEAQELDVLMDNLKPEGVLYSTSCPSEQDAKDLIKKAESAYKKKLY